MELAEALSRMGTHLMQLSNEMTSRHLDAGRPELIHIQTPQAAILFYREKGHEIAAWLHPDTHPTVARKLLEEYWQAALNTGGPGPA